MKHLLLAFIASLLPFGLAAQDYGALKEADAVGLMRHALAPGTGDPSGFDLRDCATQRTLDDRGRDQARRTGEAMRAAGLTFDAVWTSQWCRARNTATLLDVGPVIEVPALNSHFAGQGDRAGQTREMRKRLAALPVGKRVLLVSHQVNIRALAGSSTASGEVIAARRDADGQLEIIDRYLIAP
ncbi:MAG: histidine phosphatase family protein [Sulfitobacter sp.]|nr:histidine phosphatase family protein [Sulfitobacter sp.]